MQEHQSSGRRIDAARASGERANGGAAAQGSIATTTTKAGLKICAELDCGSYPTGIKASDQELATLTLKRADFHGGWNYAILPAQKKIH